MPSTVTRSVVAKFTPLVRESAVTTASSLSPTIDCVSFMDAPKATGKQWSK